MAPTPTALQAAYSATDATSYVTLSGSPVANRLQLLAVANSRDLADPSAPTTVTGCGLTWVQIGTVLYRGGATAAHNYRYSLYRALGTPSAGALTISFGSELQSSLAYSWVEFAGVQTTGTNGSGAVVQVVTAQGASTQPTATLAGFASTGNAGYLTAAQRSNATFTPEAGWTELHDVLGTTPVMALTTLWRAAGDLTPFTTSTAALNWGAFAVEIREGGAAAGTTSLTVTLPSAFADPTNDFAFGAFLRDVNAAVDPGSGLTELTDAGLVAPDLRLFIEQRKGQDLTIDALDTGANEASSWLGIAAELRAAGANKNIVPAPITCRTTVTAVVSKASPLSPSPIMGRTTVTAVVFTGKQVLPAVINGRTTATAVVNKVHAIFPSQIVGRTTVTAVVFTGKPITPSVINGKTTVSALVVKGDIEDVSLDFAMGPWPTFYSTEEIIGRTTVTALVHKAAEVISVAPVGAIGRTVVSAAITGQRAIIPEQVLGRTTVTATVLGPLPLIDFTPERKAAPTLIPSFLPGPDAIPGNFDFRPLRED